jgi:hypothetical protein
VILYAILNYILPKSRGHHVRDHSSGGQRHLSFRGTCGGRLSSERARRSSIFIAEGVAGEERRNADKSKMAGQCLSNQVA